MKPLSTEEKVALVQRIASGENVAALARETGIRRKSLYQWRAAYLALGAAGLNRKRGASRVAARRRPPPGRPTRTARRLGASPRAHRRTGAHHRPPAGGARFFSKSLAVMGRQAPKERRDHLFGLVRDMTRPKDTQGEIETQAEVAYLCRIAGLSRASYYRWREPKVSLREDADLRDLIQKLALQRRHEGYRRIAQRLKHLGLVVNAIRRASCRAIRAAVSRFRPRPPSVRNKGEPLSNSPPSAWRSAVRWASKKCSSRWCAGISCCLPPFSWRRTHQRLPCG